MSQIVYRANLSSAFFPFVSEYQGRTVIVAGQDNNFNRTLQSSADSDKDIGIPQLYYCHNVLPNGNGLQSVGYEQRVGGPGIGVMQQIFTIREDSSGSKGYMVQAFDGFRVVQDEAVGYLGVLNKFWNGAGFVSPFVPGPGSVSLAHVSGITYICISGNGIFKYNFSLNRLELVPISGLDITKIVGITESNGYLVAYSASAVAWSSTIDPTDFIPSLQTGAGGGSVEGIKGQITCASPTLNGFTIFTQVNAISVLYTGNSRYPFQFSECTGAGGVASLERVTYEADSGYNYVYTSKGFQVIQPKSAQTVFADLTDFLAGQYFEDFDEATQKFVYTTLTSPMGKKLTLIAARYLIVSYGISALTHCIVYDTVQKRFGKLKIPHVDCFEYELLTENVSDVPKKAIAFLQVDGTLVVVNFALSFTNRNGVAMLGKYQYVRSRRLQLQTADIENPTVGGKMSCALITSFDGKNADLTTAGQVLRAGRNVTTYGFGSPVGINHSIFVQGCFNLAVIELAFNVHGRM